MKHFETLWEEAEETSNNTNDNINSLLTIRNIINLFIDRELTEDQNISEADLIGRILFEISYLSNKYNINVYAELETIINEKKVEHYG